MERLGHYRLIRPAGRGATATVYEALDTRVGRRVAVKVLPPPGDLADAEREELATRLQREARAIARLCHPNVVTVYDVGIVGDEEATIAAPGTPYLVMEFLDGETIAARLKRTGTLSPTEAADVLEGAAHGLDAVHAAGVIHRDVKPANLMLVREGESADSTGFSSVKLMDFGVARAVGDATMTQHGALIGSPAYLSPEQIRGEAVTAACDRWALAVMLYEMLSGVHPFTGEPVRGGAAADAGGAGIAALVYRIARGEPPPPIPNFAPGVQAVLARALAPEANRRFPTASSFADAFRVALTDQRTAILSAADLQMAHAAMAARIAAEAGAKQGAVYSGASSGDIPVAPRARLEAPTDLLTARLPQTIAKQQDRAVRRRRMVGMAWTIVPAAAALLLFFLAVRLPRILATAEGAPGGVHPSASVSAVSPGAVLPDKGDGPTPRPDVSPSAAPSPASSRPTDTTEATSAATTVAPPTVVITERQAPAPPQRLHVPVANPGSSPARSAVQRESVAAVPAPRPALERPRIAPSPVAPVSVPGPTTMPPSQEAAIASSVQTGDGASSSGDLLTLKGDWHGTYDGSPASLTVEREDDERSTFAGTMWVETPAGQVAVAIRGAFDDASGEPRLTMAGERVIKEPTPGTWDVKSALAGRLAGEGDLIVGAGRDGAGREFLWRLRRSSTESPR